MDERLRVLLVPNERFWILGRIAEAIAEANPWLAPTICSAEVVVDLLARSADALATPDLAHFVTTHAAEELMGLLFERTPCVTTLHHVHEEAAVKYISRGDAVMTCSNEWRDWLLSNGLPADKVVLVPYGVDTRHFAPPDSATRARTRRRLGFREETTVVGFIAKRSSDNIGRKGVDVFVDALATLARDVRPLATLIVGPGWQELTAAIRSRGIGCVWYPYLVDHGDLADLYRAMDLYWVTSRIEGGPCTLLEAMSSGVCCVTTPVGIARDVVRDGVNGLMVPKDDAAAVAQRSLHLVRDPSWRERMAQDARTAMVEEYRWEDRARGVSDLYQVALRHYGARSGRATKAHLIPANLGDPVPEIVWGREYLGLIDQRHHPWVRMREEAGWLQALVQMGARRAAARCAWRAIRYAPAQRETWYWVGRAYRGALPLRILARLRGRRGERNP